MILTPQGQWWWFLPAARREQVPLRLPFWEHTIEIFRNRNYFKLEIFGLSCLFDRKHFALSTPFFTCHPVLNRYSTPHWASANGSTRAWNPNAEGSSWLALDSQIWSLLGFEEMSLAQLECFRLEWKRHTHHWILSPTRPSVLLVLWSSFKATNDGSCWRPTTRFALCKWIANGSTVSSFVSLLLVQLAMILAGWNWRFRSTTCNVGRAKDFQETVLFVSWMSLQTGSPPQTGPMQMAPPQGFRTQFDGKSWEKYTWHHELGKFACCFFRPFYSEQVLDLAHRNISRVFFPLPWFLFDL